MARYDSYPSGTPVGTDKVLYLADPAGTPAIKTALVGDLGASNPWGMLAGTGLVVGDEFDGTSGLTWIPVAPASGGGHVAWTEGNDVMSVKFGGQSNGVCTFNLLAHDVAIGETVELAASRVSATIDGAVLLAITNGTSTGSDVMVAGTYIETASPKVLWRDGTVTATSTGISTYFGIAQYGHTPRHRLTRISTSTWRYETSIDGISWTNLGIADQSWVHTPTHVGLAVSSWGSDTAGYGDLVAAFDYLRVTAGS
jgi:hypothetical protein